MVPKEIALRNKQPPAPRTKGITVVAFCFGLGARSSFLANALRLKIERQRLSDRIRVLSAEHDDFREPRMRFVDANGKYGPWMNRKRITRLRNYVFVPVPEMSKAAQSEVTEPLGITRRTITLKERTDWYVGLQEKVKVVKPESLIYGEHAEAALEEIKEKFKIA